MRGLPIYRVIKDKENPYVMLNKHFLNDAELSFRAKGLLAYLLSKPNDWQVYQSQLETASRDGRKGIRSAVKELLDAGYIARQRQRDEKGQLRESVYNVYELPPGIGEVQSVDPAKQKREKFLEVFAGGLGIEKPLAISLESAATVDKILAERQ